MRFLFLLLVTAGCASSYEKLVPTVVRVDTLQGAGTGVILNGHILTCAHVVGNSKTVFITFHDGSHDVGEVVKVDKKKDLALIRANLPQVRRLELYRGQLHWSDQVFQIGHPAMLMFSIAWGRVMYPHRFIGEVEELQLDITTVPGNSGSPVFNSHLEMVGLTHSGLQGSGISFAIPASTIVEFLR